MMKIGFIGYGHMAEAIAKGLIKAEYTEPREMYACGRDYEKLNARTGEIGVRPMETVAEVARESSIVFICVKPNQVEGVMKELGDELIGRIVVSVAFGLDFDKYSAFTKPEIKHISIIPNTPVEVCQGMIICEKKHNLSNPELDMIERMLRKLGEVIYLPGDQMWLAGEVASCGPAFAAMFIEALGDAGAKYGLNREEAYKIVAQMVAGTGRLQLETEKLPGQMVEEVATPGGVTIKGVTALREANFSETVAKAIDAIEEKK